MRFKAIAKLGFGYADVAAINPAIVYTNCSGYSRRGPDGDRPAYDDTIQAECGLPAVQQMLTGEANYVGSTPDELFENQHLNAIGFFETVQTAQGPVRFPGVPTWFSRTRGRVAGAAPALGASTREVLDELGLPAQSTNPMTKKPERR
jgi:crotonobetainyl-CoA:carnitine CoA-transferase CaiB-like acyl-CoA transferase